MQKTKIHPDVRPVWLDPEGVFPNSPLPAVILESRMKFDTESSPGELLLQVQKHVALNNWNAEWNGQVYKRPHYHSTAHEGLVVVSGWATLRLGGQYTGITVDVTPGDVVIIPAGVAHRCLSRSKRFLVIGMYPVTQKYDMRYGKKHELTTARKKIRQVPLPTHDPIYGTNGPLVRLWNIPRQ